MAQLVETTSPAAARLDLAKMRKIALASVIGTTVEWYDLFVFGTASALVFNKIFFPSFDPIVGTMLAFGTFASAYIARMVGAIIFGHFGDRLGRKSMLLISLLTMGAATFAIGLLPDYNSIGIMAPLLLLFLRVIQGLALGGEWGGAVLMTVEHAPPSRRGFYGSLVQVGVPAGTLIANVAFLIVASSVSTEALLSLGLAHPVPGLRAARGGGHLHPAAHRGNPVLPGGQGSRRQSQAALRGPHGQVLEAGHPRRRRHAVHRQHVHAAGRLRRLLRQEGTGPLRGPHAVGGAGRLRPVLCPDPLLRPAF